MHDIRYVRFPQDFSLDGHLIELHKEGRLPEIVISRFPHAVNVLTEAFAEDGWQKLVIERGDFKVYLALRGWEVYNKPRLSPSPGSDAWYYAEAADKSIGILLMFLDPETCTSDHWHEKWLEIYCLLAGRCEVKLNSGIVTLEKPGVSQLTIPAADGPEGIHPVSTRAEPCLMFISMGGALTRDDHHFG